MGCSIAVRLAAMCVAIAAAGCATVTVSPESLRDDQGLLVMKLVSDALDDPRGAQNAAPFNNFTLDHRLFTVTRRDAFVVVALAPGAHTLNSLGGYGGYVDDRQMYRTYPIERRFEIQAGRITSLGTLVLIPDSRDPEKKFLTVALRDSEDMDVYLRTTHPDLHRSLKDKNIHYAPGKYVDDAELDAIRRIIAVAKARRTNPRSRLPYAYGPLGTLARFKTNNRNELTVEIMPTGTRTGVISCVSDGARVNCLSQDSALHEMTATTFRTIKLPFPTRIAFLHRFQGNGLLVVDGHQNIHASTDAGRSWKSDNRYAKQTTSAYLWQYKFTEGKQGFYLLSGVHAVGGWEPLLFYGRYRPLGIEAVSLPPGYYDFAGVVETEAGVVLGPTRPDLFVFDKNVFHFRPNGSTEWRRHGGPPGSCVGLDTDQHRRVLYTYCQKGGEERYASHDQGMTWQKK
jgi:hypothetical protein